MTETPPTYDPDRVYDIPLKKIAVGEHKQRFQVDPSSLQDLANSIKALGLVHPVILSQKGDMFLLAIGHRRFAAHELLNFQTIRSMVSQESVETIRSKVIAENTERVDLTPVETANNIFELFNEDKLSVTAIASLYKRSEAWVKSYLAITSWPECLIQPVHTGQLSKAAAEKLAIITDMETLEFLVRNAVESGASARVCASWADSWRCQTPPDEIPQSEVPPPAGSCQPMTMVMPCIACHDQKEADALAHAYVCPQCIAKLQDGILANSPPPPSN